MTLMVTIKKTTREYTKIKEKEIQTKPYRVIDVQEKTAREQRTTKTIRKQSIK